jgi:hypothetical protein
VCTVPLFGRKSPKPAKPVAPAKPAVPALPNLELTLIEDTAQFRGRDGDFVDVHGFELAWPDGTGFPLSDDGPVDDRVYYFRVAGVTHHQATAQSDSFTPMSQVFLVPEPSNQYDPYAIQVLGAARECIGYVPSGLAPQVSSLMKRVGKSAVAATITKTFIAHGKRTAIEVLVGIERNIELDGKVHIDDDAELAIDDQWKRKG